MKISCVLTTWRRATCVERAVACFLSQDWPGEMELIIFNTDVANPIALDAESFRDTTSITVVNHGIDMVTGLEYSNTGAIRRDALTFATGTHYVTFDDDDLYFPWDMRQRVDGILATGAQAWKPYQSWMKQRGAPPFLSFNYMEASVLVDIDVVRSAGFKDASGPEHLAWFESLWNVGKMIADPDAIPGYCFYWSDDQGIAGHKQSDAAEFVRLDNFQRHKLGCTDIATRPLMRRGFPADYQAIAVEFNEAIEEIRRTKPALYEKYVAGQLTQR